MGSRLAPTLCSYLISGLVASPALCTALSPEQVFEKAAPSVVVVQVLKGGGKVAALGSGVIIRREDVVTNCHLVAAGKTFIVLWKERRISANISIADVDHDLCVLTARGLSGTPVEFGALENVRPGARVFAIGSPRGLELTISDGLVSGLRVIEESRIIQTSAPISSGSSGGGLFDSSGRLIGITTFTLTESQNLNFALPVDWVLRLQVGAGAQADIASALKAATTDRAVPSPFFADAVSGEKWLREMSLRVAAFIPDSKERTAFLKTAHYEAVRAGLNPQLLLALVEKISGFRKYAISSIGARGYMQVMPTWVSRIGAPTDNLFHLRTNLRYGCVILRHYIDKHHGETLKALNAYRNQSLGRPDSFTIDSQSFGNEVAAAWRDRWHYAGALQ